jgi:hypothetical protein
MFTSLAHGSTGTLGLINFLLISLAYPLSLQIFYFAFLQNKLPLSTLLDVNFVTMGFSQILGSKLLRWVCWTSQSNLSSTTVTKIISLIFINLVTPKARVKQEQHTGLWLIAYLGEMNLALSNLFHNWLTGWYLVYIWSNLNIYWFISIHIRCQRIQTNSYLVTFNYS